MAVLLKTVAPLFVLHGATDPVIKEAGKRLETVLKRYEAEKTSNEVMFQHNAERSYREEMDDLRSIFAQDISNEEAERRTDERSEDVLEYTEKRSVHVLLTTGGPARGYVVFLDSDDDPDSGYYWYQDWYQAKRVFWLDHEELRQVCDVYNIGSM